MTLTLTLPPELENRLQFASQQEKISAVEYTLRLLDKYLPSRERRDKLIALIQTWIEDDDPSEQRDTGEYLIDALDADRLSDRKLFPAELKGVTW